MSELTWNQDGTITVPVPKKPKKITGTRFGAILGQNVWSSPFKAWCEITRTWQEDFQDTIYTIAGKTIEPKQAEYVKKAFFLPRLVSPTDVYGADYFKQTFGDFFPEQNIFGGMWDYLLLDKIGRPDTVLEMKTTKRAEDWSDDIPEYYALQAALYAFLKGVDKVCMVCSFLEDNDYEHPENFIPSAENTILREFKVSERYPDFIYTHIRPAEDFWFKYVQTGNSPTYDEDRDKDALADLRKKHVDTSSEDTGNLIHEAEELQDRITAKKAEMKADEDRLKAITAAWKNDCMGHFSPGTNKVDVIGSRYTWTVSKTEKMVLDEDRLKDDGIYDKYLKPATTYTMRCSVNKSKKK